MVHSLKSVSIDDAISGYKVHPFIRGYLRTFTLYFFIITSSITRLFFAVTIGIAVTRQGHCKIVVLEKSSHSLHCRSVSIHTYDTVIDRKYLYKNCII